MEFRKRCLESSPRKVSATTSANESSVLLLLVRLICKKRKDAEMHCFIDLVLLGAPLEVRTLTCYTNCNGLRTSLGRCSSHADTRSSPLCWSCCWACRTRTCTHVLPIHLNRFFLMGKLKMRRLLSRSLWPLSPPTWILLLHTWQDRRQDLEDGNLCRSW